MSYQVIARKYRPQRFSDVVGQEHVTDTLSNAIAQSRIAHAYLFCGPRGTGKTTIARIFAKCLNCTGGPKVDFEESDPRCKEIAEGRSLDVLEIDAASNRGIDEIRGLRETVRYAPASSKFKVYIIDEVHMLTKEAFNALLKTLEEPPEHVKFMFATTEPEKVLPTILSRCQRFDLRRIPAALIVKHLAQISRQEKVQIDEAALFAIGRGAEGGMRDAESTLDQLISFCGNKIEEADVLSMFGLTAQSQLLELSGAMLAGEIEPALRHLNQLANQGKDLGRLLSDLLGHFRNLLVFQVSKGDLALLEVSEAEAASLRTQTREVTSETLTRILEVLGEAELRLRDASSKKILIEVAILKSIEMRNALSIDKVLRELQTLRSGGRSPESSSKSQLPATISRPSAPTAAPATPMEQRGAKTAVSPAPLSADLPDSMTHEPRPTKVVEGFDLDQIWPSLVDNVGRASQFTRTYLLEAHPISFAKGVFTIGFPPETEDHIGLVDNARNHSLIQAKLGELGIIGVNHIKFIKSEARLNRKEPPKMAVQEPAAPPASTVQDPKPTPSVATARSAPPIQALSPKEKPTPTAFSQDDFKNDPLIQKALEIFKGQIVEYRA